MCTLAINVKSVRLVHVSIYLYIAVVQLMYHQIAVHVCVCVNVLAIII